MRRKIIAALLTLMLCLSLAVTAGASQAEEILLYDEADLLSLEEEVLLHAQLLEVSQKNQAQIIVVTVDSLGEWYVDDFVEYLYDSMDFGYGEARDGVLLLVCMESRDYRILSNGYAAAAITPGDIEAIGDRIVGDLSDGYYADAFGEFADRCGYYLDGYRNGFPFDVGGSLLIALVIGLAAGLIVAFVLKGQLKSVRSQHGANVYVKPGSMHITARSDMFLYRNVTRTKKESSSSSRSGSRSSRNVGGGKF